MTKYRLCSVLRPKYIYIYTFTSKNKLFKLHSETTVLQFLFFSNFYLNLVNTSNNFPFNQFQGSSPSTETSLEGLIKAGTLAIQLLPRNALKGKNYAHYSVSEARYMHTSNLLLCVISGCVQHFSDYRNRLQSQYL